MESQETFDSQIACEQCMPLDDMSREVAPPLHLNEPFFLEPSFLISSKKDIPSSFQNTLVLSYLVLIWRADAVQEG